MDETITNKAIFLDRDGVLNRKPPEQHYVLEPEELIVLPGVGEAIKLCKDFGLKVFVITNQRGIARGILSWQRLVAIHQRLNDIIFEECGTRIDGFYVCPHNYGECNCRKPSPGLIWQARNEHKIDLPVSWLIGDSDSDIESGQNAGVGNLVKMPTDGSLLEEIKKIFQIS